MRPILPAGCRCTMARSRSTRRWSRSSWRSSSPSCATCRSVPSGPPARSTPSTGSERICTRGCRGCSTGRATSSGVGMAAAARSAAVASDPRAGRRGPARGRVSVRLGHLPLDRGPSVCGRTRPRRAARRGGARALRARAARDRPRGRAAGRPATARRARPRHPRGDRGRARGDRRRCRARGLGTRARGAGLGRRRVSIHTDLLRPNLLVTGGRIGAVIDFGAAGAGDPAADVIAAWSVSARRARRVPRGARCRRRHVGAGARLRTAPGGADHPVLPRHESGLRHAGAAHGRADREVSPGPVRAPANCAGEGGGQARVADGPTSARPSEPRLARNPPHRWVSRHSRHGRAVTRHVVTERCCTTPSDHVRRAPRAAEAMAGPAAQLYDRLAPTPTATSSTHAAPRATARPPAISAARRPARPRARRRAPPRPPQRSTTRGSTPASAVGSSGPCRIECACCRSTATRCSTR